MGRDTKVILESGCEKYNEKYLKCQEFLLSTIFENVTENLKHLHR